jgi:hypothetical protein
MNAKEQALEYAQKHNNGSQKNEEIFGQMLKEGYVISRTAGIKVVAQARREGKTIIVTETTVHTDALTGKKIESTVEIFRATL